MTTGPETTWHAECGSYHVSTAPCHVCNPEAMPPAADRSDPVGRAFKLALRRSAASRKAAKDTIREVVPGVWVAQIGGPVRGEMRVFATHAAAGDAIDTHYNGKMVEWLRRRPRTVVVPDDNGRRDMARAIAREAQSGMPFSSNEIEDAVAILLEAGCPEDAAHDVVEAAARCGNSCVAMARAVVLAVGERGWRA